MLSNNAKTTSLDDLYSHLNPTQFKYLLNILSSSEEPSSSTPKSRYDSASTDLRDFSSRPRSRSRDGNSGKYSATPSSSSSSSSPSSTQMHSKLRKVISSSDSDSPIQISPVLIDKPKTGFEKILDRLAIPNLAPQLPPNKGLLYLPVPLSAESSDKSSPGAWGDANGSRRTSIFAVKGATSTEDDDDDINDESRIAKNVLLAEISYSKIPMPLVTFQGAKLNEREPRKELAAKASCSDLPICRKFMGKYAWGKVTRSSSTESVYAESLPDPNNPMVDIAGKIANQPVNPFPVLRLPPKKAASRSRNGRQAGQGRARAINFPGTSQIESEIDRELRQFQDYRDLSEFFSKNTETVSKTKSTTSTTKGMKNKAYDLRRRVTNPLYKVYDPSGYTKSEDELAMECIQMICNDFNGWIRSLAEKPKRDSNGEINNTDLITNSGMNGTDTSTTTTEIGPDFLIQILRKNLEFPESDQETD